MAMPLADIQLLFETLLHCTREVCKCEICGEGSKICNQFGAFYREPVQ